MTTTSPEDQEYLERALRQLNGTLYYVLARKHLYLPNEVSCVYAADRSKVVGLLAKSAYENHTLYEVWVHPDEEPSHRIVSEIKKALL